MRRLMLCGAMDWMDCWRRTKSGSSAFCVLSPPAEHANAQEIQAHTPVHLVPEVLQPVDGPC